MPSLITPPKLTDLSVSFQTTRAAFAPLLASSAFGAWHFRGHLLCSVSLQFGDLLPSLIDGFVDRLQDFGFPAPSLSQATGPLTFALAGLTLAEYARLIWAHKEKCLFWSSYAEGGLPGQ